jgi:CubicO group peptidase (beta-lactamase class C family)
MPTFDQLVRDHMARYRIPGLSAAISRQGTVIHAAGYGFANLEHQVPATVDTIFQTASVGKQFTAALILLLSERGLVNIDQAIAPYFNSSPPGWSAVTIRHLLTHTSGVPDAGYEQLNPRLDYSDADLLSAIASRPLDSSPGTEWRYSNSGYVLLGLIAAMVTGRFYGDLLRDWIFTPLAMTTARVINEEDIIPNRAAGYRLEGDRLLNQEYVSPTLNRTADGGLYVTILDLVKWDRALYSSELLSPASREAMWTPVRLADGTAYPYGFGWSLGTSPRGPFVEHDGEWQGFSTHIARYLQDGLGIMLLSNLADAPVSELARAIASAPGY